MRNNLQVKIRKAKRTDLDSLVTLNREFANYHARMDKTLWRPADTAHEKVFRAYARQALKKHNFLVLLAYADKQLIGYSLGYLDEPELEDTILAPYHRRYGYIAALYIRKEHQSMGAGRAMFNELVRWFRGKGVNHIELMVDTCNHTGIRAWKRYGFTEFMKRMELTF